MLTFIIAAPDHARRLESFLRTLMPLASAGYCRKLIRSGSVRLNGSPATPDTFLSLADNVTLKESATVLAHLAAPRPALDILYEDDRVVAVNKPSGLPMHRTAEREPNLVDLGMAFMEGRGTPCKLYPVNRLDKGTSGVVLMAKSSASAGIYGRLVKESGLDKLYLALVAGVPPREGTIDVPLDGKESETRFRTLLAGEAGALLAITPLSGRMHQIRQHLEMIGHPVVGDKRYGSRELDDYPGFCLHSFRTAVPRPDETSVTVCAPLPEGLILLCGRSGMPYDRLLQALAPSLRGHTTSHEEDSA